MVKHSKHSHASTVSNSRPLEKEMEGDLPLYQQVYRHLRDKIFDGTFERGSKFPSENELCVELQVSRVTVRRALDELASHGLIQRKQGKASIVTAYKPQTSVVATVEGLVENNRRMGDQTWVELLASEYVPASKEIASRMRVRPGKKVLWTVRVRYLDNVPFSYAVTYLPQAVAKKIDVTSLASKPLISLLEEAGFDIGRAEQLISATSATPDVARALHIDKNAALLVSDRLVFDANDQPVELIIVQYRPDVYHYGIELVRTKSLDGHRWSQGDR